MENRNLNKCSRCFFSYNFKVNLCAIHMTSKDFYNVQITWTT